MDWLKRYKYHLMAALILLAALLFSVRTKVNQVTEKQEVLPKIETQGQLEHALELFPRLHHPELLSMDAKKDLRSFIFNYVRESLPETFKDQAYIVSRAIIVEANHHKMDPLFFLAVIMHESRFNPKVIGSHGEIGLMQILPKTAEWLAPQAGLSAGKINLEDPATNIRLGATYFAQLRKSFNNRGSRYLAAYNMGSLNVRRLLAQNLEPKVYPEKVMAHYEDLYSRLGTPNMQANREIASAR